VTITQTRTDGRRTHLAQSLSKSLSILHWFSGQNQELTVRRPAPQTRDAAQMRFTSPDQHRQFERRDADLIPKLKGAFAVS
jgi:hypothetical protein